METLLLINSSARSARSVTRQLTARFAANWAKHHPEGEIISRDVGLNPPSFINETWISDAFAEPNGQPLSLATSEALIDELFRASAVVIGAPMYNFGMPAQLKAYVDQVVRVGRTFAFASGNAEWPYQPLIPARPLTIITSAGAAGYEPGGPAAHLNFLEPHLEAVFKFIGVSDITFVRIGSEEHQGGQFRQSMAGAERSIDQIVERIATGSRVAMSE